MIYWRRTNEALRFETKSYLLTQWNTAPEKFPPLHQKVERHVQIINAAGVIVARGARASDAFLYSLNGPVNHHNGARGTDSAIISYVEHWYFLM